MIPVQNILKAYKSNENIAKNPPHKLDLKTESETYLNKVSKNTKKSFADLLEKNLRR